MKRLTFEVKFHARSTHFVSVVLHKNRRVMRGFLRRLGHDSTETNACCWQANKPQKDGLVAEIHFGRDFLTLDTIVHEASHAAFHRVQLAGIPLADNDFQEFLSESTGTVVDTIVAFFDRHKIAVKYQTVPTRRLI